jgi:hypothetical protein
VALLGSGVDIYEADNIRKVGNVCVVRKDES